MIFVPRRIVLGEVFLDGNLFGLLLVVFLGGFFLQYGVFLDLLLDALFELNGGQLQQFDHLDLLRRQFLQQFLYLALVDVRHIS